MMNRQIEAKVRHDVDDTRRMVADRLTAQIDAIRHIGIVPWDARHGYVKLCHCQGGILSAVTVLLGYAMTIRDGDGTDSLVLQGKCAACEMIYIAEVQEPS